MSDDSFTEVTSEGWLSRLGGAIKGVFIGLGLFVLAFPLLFWNEGRMVTREKTINFAAEKAVAVDAAQIDASNDKQLIHFTATAEPQGLVKDDYIGVEAKSIALNRTVEMYQWEQTEESKKQKKMGGGEETITTYKYNKVWSERFIDSRNFHERERANKVNPIEMPIKSERFYNTNVTAGAFNLPSNLVSSISNYKPLMEVPALTKIGNRVARKEANGYYLPAPMVANVQTTETVAVDGPQIGDIRIKYTQVPATDISVMAMQNGKTLGKFITPNGQSFQRLEVGTKSIAEMIASAHSENSVLTWILRVVGFFMMLIGLGLVFKPLSVLADIIPLIGDFVEMGTGLVAFLIALPCTLITVSIAWIFYRPLIGVPLLVVSVGLFFVLWKKRQAVKAAA